MRITKLYGYFPFLMLIFLALTFSLPSTKANPQKNQEKSVGDLAPDFGIIDIHTNKTSMLSDYLGKVIILDLFATWCGPCIVALPQIIRIQNSYNATDLQIISIDIDLNESYSQVMEFALEHSMSWIVSLDISLMNGVYGTGYIPTLYIINQTGYVAYQEIGFNYQGVINALDKLITPDSMTPVIENPQIIPITSPLTFSHNKLTIEADNISDNLGVYETFVQIDNGQTIKNISLSKGVSGALSTEFAIPPSLLFDTSQISVSLGVTDYRGNQILSTEVEIPVEKVDVDLAPPTISDVSIEYDSNSTHYFFTASARISDDVFVDEVTMLLKEGNQPQGYTVEDVTRNSDDMTLFTGYLALKKTIINDPERVGVIITATDIAGKKSNYPTNSTDDNTTPIFPIYIILMGLFGLFLIRKLRVKL